MATAQMPNPKVDPVKADSRHYTVEFENDKIRVVRIKYGAKEKSVMHSHPESVSVFLNDCKAKFTYPDGKSENIEAKAQVKSCTWMPLNTIPRTLAARLN